jgi:MtaA/CmuA family methyltransferase
MAGAQLKASRDFGIDMLLTCSDPAREVIDLAGEGSVRWYPDQPPAIDEGNPALKDKTRLARLNEPDPAGPGRMGDRVRAIDTMRREAGDGAVIVGWVEGALALSAELRGINAIMTDFYDDADFVAELMDFCADVAIGYMRVQIDAGADSIGMSDAAASMIGPEFYEEFLWPRQMRILAAIRDMGAMTRLHMCGCTDPLLEQMEKLPVDVYELDFMTDVARAREVLGPDRVICGNVDTISTMLYGGVDEVREAAERARTICGERHVISPGCEVAPETPPENVRELVRLAREAPRR